MSKLVYDKILDESDILNIEEDIFDAINKAILPEGTTYRVIVTAVSGEDTCICKGFMIPPNCPIHGRNK